MAEVTEIKRKKKRQKKPGLHHVHPDPSVQQSQSMRCDGAQGYAFSVQLDAPQTMPPTSIVPGNLNLELARWTPAKLLAST